MSSRAASIAVSSRVEPNGKFSHPKQRKGLHSGWCSGTWVRGRLTGPDCMYAFDGLDTTYRGNVDNGRICGWGRVSYPDHRVAHGTRKRVRSGRKLRQLSAAAATEEDEEPPTDSQAMEAETDQAPAPASETPEAEPSAQLPTGGAGARPPHTRPPWRQRG